MREVKREFTRRPGNQSTNPAAIRMQSRNLTVAKRTTIEIMCSIYTVPNIAKEQAAIKSVPEKLDTLGEMNPGRSSSGCGSFERKSSDRVQVISHVQTSSHGYPDQNAIKNRRSAHNHARPDDRRTISVRRHPCESIPAHHEETRRGNPHDRRRGGAEMRDKSHQSSSHRGHHRDGDASRSRSNVRGSSVESMGGTRHGWGRGQEKGRGGTLVGARGRGDCGGIE